MKKIKSLIEQYISEHSVVNHIPKNLPNYEELIEKALKEESWFKVSLEIFLEWLSKSHCIVEKDVVEVLYDNIRRNGNMPIEEGDEEIIKSRLTVLRTVFSGCGIDWDNIPEYD